jgi:MYXO-CTERM domain-containing protein
MLARIDDPRDHAEDEYMNVIKKMNHIGALCVAALLLSTSPAQAVPCTVDDDCQDGLFCNGVETCDATDPNADADGCVDGTRPDPSDGIDCTFDSCDEGADEEDNLGTFRNVVDNGACDDGDPCTMDVCTAGVGCGNQTIGCTIADTCHLDDALNPSNPCQVCDIDLDTAAWTPTNSGMECAGVACDASGASLVAPSTCDAAGACIPGDSTACTNGCQEAEEEAGADVCRDECTQDEDCPSGWCDLDGDRQCSTANRPPVARAGDDQQVGSELVATLNGGGSFDPDADLIASFRWSQSRGPTVELSDPAARNPTFTAPRVREGEDEPELVFALIVNDGELDSEPDFTTVTVTAGVNRAPVASISGPSGVDAGIDLTLDGSESSDPDGDAITTYQWTQTAGPDATLGDTDGATLEVSLPDAIGESVTFELVVSDGVTNSEPASLTIELLEPLAPPTGGGGDEGGGCAHTPGAPGAPGGPLAALAALALGALLGRRARPR